MRRSRDTRVRLLVRHARSGQPGDCYRCAMALALQEATGDDEARVYERDWVMYVEVHGRHLRAPAEVRRFVNLYDAMGIDEAGNRVRPDRLTAADLKPFTFALPPRDDPEWEVRSCCCEELFPPNELDDEGVCPDCKE